MHPPKRLPPGLDGIPFAVRDAFAQGVTRDRTRAGDLDRPFRGIRAPHDPDRSFVDLCRAYAAAMPGSQCFSHVTAARLVGLPLPLAHQRSPRLHVTAALPGRAPRAAGVVGHHAEPEGMHIVRVGGLRVTSPVQTWRDLATVLSVRDLIAVGDALVRRQLPFASMADLRRVVEGSYGRRGARMLREAFASVRSGVDSPRETEVRLIIVEAGLPEPEVNVAIRDHHGVFLALGDLVYPEYRILIEYDGAHHFAGGQQMYKDIDRLDAVMQQRWRVIRLNKTHLKHPGIVAAKVRSALLDAGWRP